MDPAWAAILISAVGVVVSGLSAFFGTKIAVARIEVKQELSAKQLEDHEERLRAIERGPLDYAR